MRPTLLAAAVVLPALASCGTAGDEQLREDLAAATAEAAAAPRVPDSGEGSGEEGLAEPVQVRAALVDPEGSTLGTASLRDEDLGVELSVEVHGMTPGYHGMALHGVGDCTSPDPQDEAFRAVDEQLLVLPPVLVLESGIGVTATLISSEAVVEELLVGDGSAVVVGPAVDALPAVQAPPLGSRRACAAFGEDLEVEPVNPDEGSTEEQIQGDEDADSIDRGTGGLDDDDDEDTDTP